jgi:hypothetical protein
VLLNSTDDEDLMILVCKAICNLVLDTQKSFAKEEGVLTKFIKLTRSTNSDIRVAAVCTIKNFLFKCSKDIRGLVMKEISNDYLLELLGDENYKVQE